MFVPVSSSWLKKNLFGSAKIIKYIPTTYEKSNHKDTAGPIRSGLSRVQFVTGPVSSDFQNVINFGSILDSLVNITVRRFQRLRTRTGIAVTVSKLSDWSDPQRAPGIATANGRLWRTSVFGEKYHRLL